LEKKPTKQRASSPLKRLFSMAFLDRTSVVFVLIFADEVSQSRSRAFDSDSQDIQMIIEIIIE
jgi:hypothetical protein